MSTSALVAIRSLSLLVFLSQMAACLVAHPLEEYSGGPPSAEAGYAADGRDGPDADGGPADTGARPSLDAPEPDSGVARPDVTHVDAEGDAASSAPHLDAAWDTASSAAHLDAAWDAASSAPHLDAAADVIADGRVAEVGVDAASDNPATEPRIRLEPDDYHDFKSLFVGEEKAHTFQIVNDGPGEVLALTSTIQSMTRTTHFRVSSTTCDGYAALASGSRCDVTVTAKPAAATVGTTANLRVTYVWAGKSWFVEAVLKVSATKGAILSLTPSNHPFPDTLIGSSSTQQFVVQNTGDAPANLGMVSTAALQLSGPFALHTASTTCASHTVLAAGANCWVYVTFTPTTTSTHDGTIELAYYGGLLKAASADLSGKGLDGPELSFGKLSHDFGTAAVGNNIEYTFTLTNHGDVAGAIESPLSTVGLRLSSGYTFLTSTCSNITPLPPQAACTISIRFAPPAVGTFGASLTIKYSGGLGPDAANVRLIGRGTT